MKLTTSLILVTLAGGTLWAQAPAKTPAPAPAKIPAASSTASKPATAAPKPMAAKPAEAKATPAVTKTTTAPVNTAAPSKPAATATKTAAAPAKPVAPAPKTVAATAKPVVEKPKPAVKQEEAEMVAKPASAKEQQTATRVSGAAGRRDPFVSPIVRATTGGGPACETGKRCLMVDQIVLKGIVKSPNGFIAVVENPLKRAYFLRENDPVFNGSVIKITGDTVIFREATTDKVGKQSTREVVKKVNAPVV